MNTGKEIFAQAMVFVVWKTFHRTVARHGARLARAATLSPASNVY
jgi:hypothetical protein